MNNSKAFLGTVFLGVFFALAVEGTYAAHHPSETRPIHQNGENMKPGASKVGCSPANPYGC